MTLKLTKPPNIVFSSYFIKYSFGINLTKYKNSKKITLNRRKFQ